MAVPRQGVERCELALDASTRELVAHGTQGFPCAPYEYDLRGAMACEIPWHWHDDIEVVRVLEGTVDARVPGVRFELAAGDTLVLNVETPHYLMVPAGSVMRSFVFAPRLICGTRDSVFAARYFDPVIGVHALASLVVPEPERTQVARAFDEAFRALAEGASGYEFAVREQLSRIWLVFFGHAAARDDRAHVTDAMHAQDMERIRLMLDFIEGHAAENISLADIAAVADVCERECLRCFQRALGISPMRYVMRWRVMHGAELLVQERALSIAEVARRAGIPSASNFSRLFKRLYGMTPRAWRERASGAGLPPYACGRPEG